MKVFWQEIVHDIPGNFQVIRRISALRLKLGQWNKTEFGIRIGLCKISSLLFGSLRIRLKVVRFLTQNEKGYMS
jgi:hypothetical protein